MHEFRNQGLFSLQGQGRGDLKPSWVVSISEATAWLSFPTWILGDGNS